jgi:hypothetical protein
VCGSPRPCVLVPAASFSFEWGGGVLLWLAERADAAEWGSPVNADSLPISTGLREELTRLGQWHDSALNWRYPPDPGPWRQDDCDRFHPAAGEALRRRPAELGPDWHIAGDIPQMREDPDLDRYPADPDGFTRDPTAPP